MQNNFLAENENSLNLYLKEISKFKPLKRKEEHDLIIKAKKGDAKAMQKLIEANLRFVVSVASNYRNQGMPLSDLVNEGNIGLIRAAKRFDETKGYKFISYAVWWIRQAILQAMSEQSRIMKLPLNRVSTIHNIGKVVNKLEQKLKRFPTYIEIASFLKIDEEEVREAFAIGNSHDSLDSPFSNNEDSTLMDLISNDQTPSPDENIDGYFLSNELGDLLNTLKRREADVLRLYYGIDCERSHTLEEIAAKYGLTRERIRQIKERAIKRLKHPSRNASLRKFHQA
ncbi:MAG: RNA polymerase subunit sigma [Candidatus Raymondbacteria bacterium RifOxyC12_full_50_8]|uniref:RNA polymerase subunit sigma n=1 Tax=Candidatus Raymondbacteria bacterium RIFOXYD12_FULL_49_13 TaxID=1817890 RepID=A0A1F7FHF5_UNCRA|nr:MAG: RNA polymerase subunit sigma [Candidatus Raymondbacteria bacterium RIFOXYA2_FULL_49_16]OGJ94016.1 MAG: RNA polymerase subunit sigma [Candidatus Raymondbacteria bacterium RifOxyB12_full_50_8]OGK00114.1 MAG: RNA polymerase subunit sigma [Candidatus Raymondbacteria bacterium RifOxyC12_full_50_8]OGK06154.1 MAG: RNA polymerase subunit sigma [Candidatus Raymondbacteria bacterium RIFOXYD12_FULL_49_13]OGP42832.1 MAG: RNA polymerase subunit sigma [Candidatus Raymondbacteria bacterium RIFOXYB2_FU